MNEPVIRLVPNSSRRSGFIASPNPPGASAMLIARRPLPVSTCEELPTALLPGGGPPSWMVYVALAALMAATVWLVWP